MKPRFRLVPEATRRAEADLITKPPEPEPPASAAVDEARMDGQAQGWAEGYAAGHRDGHAEAERSEAAARLQLRAEIESALALAEIEQARVAHQTASQTLTIALRLVEAVAGVVTPVASEALEKVLYGAIALRRPATQLICRGNPKTLDAMQALLEELGITPHPDPDMLAGGIVVTLQGEQLGELLAEWDASVDRRLAEVLGELRRGR
jgi:flagellar biosynthesis/type III secretory pathway protein FliH